MLLPNRTELLAALLLGCLVVSVAGCSSSEGMEVWPVAGRVTVGGKPAAGADVAFFGLDDELKSPMAPFPQGTTDEEGHFQVTSYMPDDGAPAGRYVVTIVWPRDQSADPESRDDSPDRLRGRYSSPETSSIEVEVAAGDNKLPDFAL